MPIGPFDRRKKRSRCFACAASHLKCSGSFPCNNCQKKRVSCTFEKQKPDRIRIDYAESGKKSNREAVPILLRSSAPQLSISPSAVHTYYLSHYFDTFLKRNTINPHTKVSIDVVQLMKDQVSGDFLHHAVLSIGAMQAVKLNSSEGISSIKAYNLAVGHYSKSVQGLRQALDQYNQLTSSLHCVLWTTYLLGLFELMTDASGAGWVQHLVHGTSKALIAAGPSVCQSTLGRRFFTEIRVFEACRSIIFNEPTFLANPDWKRTIAQIQNDSHSDIYGLNVLLDIVVSCSTLRVRVRQMLYSSDVQTQSGNDTPDSADDIALEGFRLRQCLIDWEATTPSPESQKLLYDDADARSFCLLARTFFAATSIYLSGVFDYEMSYWHSMNIVPAVLSEEEIQGHVIDILNHTNTILYQSSISPLLVLFPLRVAGARSWFKWQQDCIMQSLVAVESTFPVAAAFRDDLQGVWGRRSTY
ncbi:hypothetical protein FLONG3_7003 [Fusarium longipes]|uniref:Zn(2)-C6 fungal-type domain-containing protein n=1 Tax=Fusarium longipes TaxID=694270 RepID=A0A395SI07_9HYPO|nr:hypothetical protein FLONG3_7003 [Fusarium longipes]